MGQYNSIRRRLSQKLRQEIIEKGLKAGDRIESVRTLAARYGVAPLTMHRVLALLVQEGFLYQEARSGTFVKENQAAKPIIGYLGMVPSPTSPNCLLDSAINEIFNVFTAAKCPPTLISYQEMLSAAGERKLAKLNGLLVFKSFVDQYTRPILKKFRGKIVLVEHDSSTKVLNVNQVIPDYQPALAELACHCNLLAYEKFLIVRAGHENALATEQEIRVFLSEMDLPSQKISTLELSSKNPEMGAFLHFHETSEDWRNTLLISLSGYYSQGIYHALQNRENRPDILSFDNLEDYADLKYLKEPFFTAIDRSFARVFRTGAELLLKQVMEDDDRRVIIKVPARLVVRQSIANCNSKITEKTSPMTSRHLKKASINLDTQQK